MTASTYRSIRLFILRWHRRVGVMLCFVIIWIATTGIFLNHMHEWKLSDKLVHNAWVRQQYAVTQPLYFPLDESSAVVQTAGGEILLNQQPLSFCDKAAQGAALVGAVLAIACPDSLILATPSGDVLEVVGAGQGLPTPLKGLAVEQQQLLLLTQQWYVFSDIDLSFSPSENWPEPIAAQPMPETLRALLGDSLEAQPISWERLMIDMHTGAFWGENKTLISDIAAVLMMLIALGGVWVWLTKPGRFRRQK